VTYDLGAGVGAVGLALLHLGATERVVFVEMDRTSAGMAERNLEMNGWAARGEVLIGDVRAIGRRRQGQATLIVCNPPYFRPGEGRPPERQEAARTGQLDIFVQAARQLGGPRARVCFVYPAQSLAALLSTLAAQGLHAKRLRFVHPMPDAPARLALVEARPGRAGGLTVLPACVERDRSGYTPELGALLSGLSPRPQ
jgi:tRNA1Val (adenine37-N6)-methyltransferase